MAVAVVVVHHLQVPAIRGGWLGVDIFFALSGFLITLSVLRLGQSGKGLGHFWRRRFWRVAPALAVVLVGFVLAAVLVVDDPSERLSFASAAALQWMNVQGALSGPFSPHLGHIWSLSAEIQFYLMWPLVLVALIRLRAPRWLIFSGLVAAFVATAVERAVLESAGAVWNRLYLAPDTRAAALLGGCMVGLLAGWGVFEHSPVLRTTLRVLLVPALGALAVAVVTADFLASGTYYYGLTVAALAAAVVVGAGAVGMPWPFGTVFASAPLAWLGRISYSVYLWHVPIIAALVAMRPEMDLATKAAIVVPATLVVGWLSYLLVERPFFGGVAGLTRRRTVPSDGFVRNRKRVSQRLVPTPARSASTSGVAR